MQKCCICVLRYPYYSLCMSMCVCMYVFTCVPSLHQRYIPGLSTAHFDPPSASSNVGGIFGPYYRTAVQPYSCLSLFALHMRNRSVEKSLTTHPGPPRVDAYRTDRRETLRLLRIQIHVCPAPQRATTSPSAATTSRSRRRRLRHAHYSPSAPGLTSSDAAQTNDGTTAEPNQPTRTPPTTTQFRFLLQGTFERTNQPYTWT